MKGIESVPEIPHNENQDEIGSVSAENQLEYLLDRHPFLTEVEQNDTRINEAETDEEALEIAQDLIEKRLAQTFSFELMDTVEEMEDLEVSAREMLEIMEEIKAHHLSIGEGADALVFIDKNELPGLPKEACYKFFKKEATQRGRNSLLQETELQAEFHRTVKSKMPETRIGVPAPYYATEVDGNQVMTMEKLPAASVDNILRGRGSLPEWFDVDEFCTELEAFLDGMHEEGLYHRDMHPGNIMITQSSEEPAQWGYIIDFGLSAHGSERMDPYRKEEAGRVFTYNDDYGIVPQVQKELTELQIRLNRE